MWGDIMTRRRNRNEQPEPSINASLELFEGLSRPELTRLGRFFTQIDVAEGRDLGRRGTECQYFVVVLRGQIAMSFDESPAGILTPGCFYGAMALLSADGDHRRRGSATALVDSRLAIASPSELSGLLHEFPLIEQRVRAVVARRRDFVASVGQDRFDRVAADRIEYQVHVPVSA